MKNFFPCVMVELLKSKEFKAMARCATKECPQFKAVMAAQTALAKEVEALAKDPTPSRIKHIMASLKALHSMEDRRNALLCKITRCSEAYAALELKRVDDTMRRLVALEPLFDSGVRPTRARATKWTRTGKRSS